MSAGSDRERLSQVVLNSLDEATDSHQLARRAYRSRTQFFRVFRATIAETRLSSGFRHLAEPLLSDGRHPLHLDAGRRRASCFTPSK
jgi:hypothetical protein